MSLRPCPRCSQPLEIPRPQPAKVQCPRCQAVLRLTPFESERGAPTSPTMDAPQPAAATKAKNLFGLTPLPATHYARSGSAFPRPRRRRSHVGGLIMLFIFMVVVAGALVAFLLFRG